jgi:hypothetical protein
MLKKIFFPNFPRIIEVFTQKIVTKLSKIWVWDPEKKIPDPGVKKAPVPGSATLLAFRVEDVDRVGATRDPQLLRRAAEEVMKDAAVHCGGRDDHPEVRALRQQVLGESQEDVRVDGPLVDFVEDEAGVVA